MAGVLWAFHPLREARAAPPPLSLSSRPLVHFPLCVCLSLLDVILLMYLLPVYCFFSPPRSIESPWILSISAHPPCVSRGCVHNCG